MQQVDIMLLPDARVMFSGLWTLTDREGRLEDRPARIKSLIFPYDDDVTVTKVTELLDQLASGSFILCHQVDGKRFIWIRGFYKHQHCRVREQASQLPEPPEDIAKLGASMVQGDDEHRTSPSASTSTYGIRLLEGMLRIPQPEARGAGHPRKPVRRMNLKSRTA
jgi:hypothetical protein